MAKLYLDKSSNKNKVEKLAPRKETIAFILNYSKALYVMKDKNLPLDTILN